MKIKYKIENPISIHKIEIKQIPNTMILEWVTWLSNWEQLYTSMNFIADEYQVILDKMQEHIYKYVELLNEWKSKEEIYEILTEL